MALSPLALVRASGLFFMRISDSGPLRIDRGAMVITTDATPGQIATAAVRHALRARGVDCESTVRDVVEMHGHEYVAPSSTAAA